MAKIGDKGREVEELEIEGTSFMNGPLVVIPINVSTSSVVLRRLVCQASQPWQAKSL